MRITQQEKDIFCSAIEAIQESFKKRDKEKDIGSIGGDTIGISQMIAEYDVAESGNTSGAYINTIEKALSIGQALRVLQFLDQFVDFAESLENQGAINYDSKVESSGIDEYCYVQSRLEELGYSPRDNGEKLTVPYYELWMETQSKYYVFRLSRVKVIEGLLWINTYSYSAREVSCSEYRKGEARQIRFDYNDCRDDGYCGTLKWGCAPYVDYGYYYHKEFKLAFERLFFNVGTYESSK